MATDYVDPDGDGTQTEWASTGATHWDEINNAVRQPDTDSITTDYISAVGAIGTVDDEFDMTTLTVGSVSSVKVWVYGITIGVGSDVNADIYMNGGWVGAQEIMDTNVGENGWYSTTFNGAWSQADLNAMQIRLTTIANHTTVNNKIFEMYAEITYTAAAVTGFMVPIKYWGV